MSTRKLRPSQDVVQRIRWDARFRPEQFRIAFRQREGGLGHEGLLAFLASGRIPWSRVERIERSCGEAVWDRTQRRDRVFGSGETAAGDRLVEVLSEQVQGASSALASAPPDDFLVPLRAWGFAGGTWRPQPEPPTETLSMRPLRVVTWNVLFDRFKADQIQTARRTPALLDHLERLDADLIALQEVTPPFLEALLQAPWARAYRLSDGPAATTVSPNGQLLLSRVPLRRLGLHPFSVYKQALVAELAFAEPLVVVGLHLTSNMTPKAPQVRAQQLQTLRRYLQRQHAASDWLIVGDFNQGEEERDGGLASRGVQDVWSTLRPDEEGHTFAPASNELAALMSSTGRGARFDRVLLRSRSDRWRPVSVRLVGTEPIEPIEPEPEEAAGLTPEGTSTEEGALRSLWPSDHFGLCAQLTPGDGLHAAAVHQSAVVIVPPRAAWPALQRLRAHHDDRYRRWPPHVNLLYGFLPVEHFPAAAQRLHELLREERPLPLRLESLGAFRHRRRATLWAVPEPGEALKALQARLTAAFPQCDEQATKSEAGFTPHLSVGKLAVRTAADAEEARARLTAEFTSAAPEGLGFEVDAVHLIARRGREPFEVWHSVPLGPPRSLSEALRAAGFELGADARAARQRVLAELRAACAPHEVHALGSQALGVAISTSDLDLAFVAPAGSGRARLEALRAAWGGRLTGSGPDAVLRCARGGVEVDVQRVEPDDLALREPAALRARVGEAQWGAFAEALRALKGWASAQRVDAQAFGFLGGVAWASLLAEACVEARASRSSESSDPPPLGAEELLVAAFTSWATLPSERPSVPAQAEPSLDLAKGLTRGTWALLQARFARAAELSAAACAGRGAWSGLFVPAPPPAPPLVALRLEGVEPERELAFVSRTARGALEILEGDDTSAPRRVAPDPERDAAWGFCFAGEFDALTLARLERWLVAQRPPGPFCVDHRP